jgi:hypothetical protein
MAKTTVDETETFEERTYYANKTLPKLYANSFALATAMLKSNLFRPGSGTRMVFSDYTKLNVTGGWTLEYKGEELRQDDQRLLLALIKLRSGQVVSNVITFIPRTFCHCEDTLNWADSSDSTEKLYACIKRLHDARVRLIRDDGIEYLYSFISDAVLEKESWSVTLSQTMAEMFDSQVTYIQVDRRLAMKDGLLAWIYGFIKADACHAPIDLHSLRALAGSTYTQKDFNRHLKKALESLVAVEVIREFKIARSKLTVKKAFKS